MIVPAQISLGVLLCRFSFSDCDGIFKAQFHLYLIDHISLWSLKYLQYSIILFSQKNAIGFSLDSSRSDKTRMNILKSPSYFGDDGHFHPSNFFDP